MPGYYFVVTYLSAALALAGVGGAQAEEHRYVNGDGYCDRMIHEIYTEQPPVIWAHGAADKGDYYEMEAVVDHGLEDNGYTGESFRTTIRVKKDAVVYYRGAEMDPAEYQNLKDSTEGAPFEDARMLGFEQDEAGYIVSFSDVDAG